MTTFSVTRTINAPLAATWQVAGEEFGEIADWFPNVTDSRLEGNDGEGIHVGTKRICGLPPGGKVDELIEEVVDWQEGKRFAYDIVNAPKPIKQWRNAWIFDDNGDRTTVTLESDMTFAGGPLGPLLARLAWKQQVRKISETLLNDLKGEVESRVTPVVDARTR